MNGCTDPTPFSDDCDRDECTAPVGGEHADTCGLVEGATVRVLNDESCFAGLVGTVTRRIDRTVMVAFGVKHVAVLPFGASEVTVAR